MKIGIDISQLAYPNTGVANYVTHLVEEMIMMDSSNEYILFFSSLRGKLPHDFAHKISGKARIKTFRLPPSALDLLWNRLHIAPIENFIGNVDVFISSDWSQPPARKAHLATILYDLVIYKYPEETHDKAEFTLTDLKFSANIVAVQRRRLRWVRRDCQAVFCISQTTKQDAVKILGIPEDKLFVTYPGLTQ